ncbi:HU family DNA-binding protein [Psychrobacter sp. FDAARGOS_221]|uniref:HU family DNA-binding protein n=1 Tax=Psychrobacter sp. FDAARGOS_221 TaxID=1975705 RepID=UPI000BB54005|nr:HU family DNA-binding protein [Psychrobacter sp. FDAARGOS_221]PNK59935.1 HU family DNA-binding protein [Psychrobacter sp. FDAARGOS_221]PNK61482.1 HU family DNA-binding protein [Psychrobacter sp. FDAARGOS_221]
MNKQDLINKMAEDAGITKEQARSALQAFEYGVTEALANGDNVQMVGFGTFSTAKRKSRIGRNPKTGESLQIPAKNVAKFKAGKSLDEAVN